MKKKAMRRILAIALFAALPCIGFAQPDPGGDPDDTPIPFDGGLSLVIAAGVGYGVKKAYTARKQNKEVPKKWFEKE